MAPGPSTGGDHPASGATPCHLTPTGATPTNPTGRTPTGPTPPVLPGPTSPDAPGGASPKGAGGSSPSDTGDASLTEGSARPVVVRPVPGLPEIRPGDDLAGLLAAAVPTLAEGEIVVVSSKIVSKAEGRLVEGADRAEVVAGETVRVVANRGPTRIVQTRHGFVMAAAGVDNSNVALGSLVLLPVDPDGSARVLRRELALRLGLRRIGVLVTDTFGRPWRLGQTDLAIGAAGVRPLGEYAGRTDAHGNELAVTAPAYADELSAAADLVKAKLAQVPVAVISGLPHLVTEEDGPGVRAMVRPASEDLFSLGTREAMRAAVRLPREAAGLADQPYDLEAVRRIVSEFSPAEDEPWRFREIREVEEAKPLLDAAGLPSTGCLLAVEAAPDAGSARAERLRAGEASSDRPGGAAPGGSPQAPPSRPDQMPPLPTDQSPPSRPGDPHPDPTDQTHHRRTDGPAPGRSESRVSPPTGEAAADLAGNPAGDAGLRPDELLSAGASVERLCLALAVEGFGTVRIRPPDPERTIAVLAVGAAG